MDLDKRTREILLKFQENEITEYHIYSRLAKTVRDEGNARVLDRIAREERDHYEVWRKYTKTSVRPNRAKLWFYYLIARLFGLTFGIRLMELGEEKAQAHYAELAGVLPEAEAIANEEHQHELALIELLDEELLRYVSSIVLGLNDALVELTGALAGLTLALQDTRLISLTGSITGIAAALSMGASEYLATKTEETTREPIRAAVYTGGTYLITVLLLILPFLLMSQYFSALGVTLLTAILIIAFFNYYISVAKEVSFRERFLEMAGLSLGVAAFTFLIGLLLRTFLGIEV